MVDEHYGTTILRVHCVIPFDVATAMYRPGSTWTSIGLLAMGTAEDHTVVPLVRTICTLVREVGEDVEIVILEGELDDVAEISHVKCWAQSMAASTLSFQARHVGSVRCMADSIAS